MKEKWTEIWITTTININFNLWVFLSQDLLLPLVIDVSQDKWWMKIKILWQRIICLNLVYHHIKHNQLVQDLFLLQIKDMCHLTIMVKVSIIIFNVKNHITELHSIINLDKKESLITKKNWLTKIKIQLIKLLTKRNH